MEFAPIHMEPTTDHGIGGGEEINDLPQTPVQQPRDLVNTPSTEILKERGEMIRECVELARSRGECNTESSIAHDVFERRTASKALETKGETKAEAKDVPTVEMEVVKAREAANAAAEAHQAALDELDALQPAYDDAVRKEAETKQAAVIAAKAAHAAEDAAKAAQ